MQSYPGSLRLLSPFLSLLSLGVSDGHAEPASPPANHAARFCVTAEVATIHPSFLDILRYPVEEEEKKKKKSK
jgi:hypothetical protein